MRSWTLKHQSRAQGTKLGNPIPAALPRKLAAFHWEPVGQGWAHTALCRASALVQEGCRRMPPVGGSVWVYLDAAGAAVRCSSHSWCTGDQFGWSPFRPYPSLAALETLWMIFAAYCHDLAKCERAVNLTPGKMHFSAVCTGHCLEIPLICSFAFLPFEMKKKKLFPASHRLMKNQSLRLSCGLI